MKLFLRLLLLLYLVSCTLTQELDLSEALDDLVPPPTPPKPNPPVPKGNEPKSDDDHLLDLLDAIEPDKPLDDPKKSGGTDDLPKSGGGDFGFDLTDALGPDDPKPDKTADKPSSPRGGGGSLSDSDLFDLAGGDGDGDKYKPEGGHGGGGSYPQGGGDEQPQEAGAGPIAGIVSAVGVALLGAASSYFAYQKKKLCFKIQGGADPEKGGRGTHQQPQLFSSLLQSN